MPTELLGGFTVFDRAAWEGHGEAVHPEEAEAVWEYRGHRSRQAPGRLRVDNESDVRHRAGSTLIMLHLHEFAERLDRASALEVHGPAIDGVIAPRASVIRELPRAASGVGHIG